MFDKRFVFPQFDVSCCNFSRVSMRARLDLTHLSISLQVQATQSKTCVCRCDQWTARTALPHFTTVSKIITAFALWFEMHFSLQAHWPCSCNWKQLNTGKIKKKHNHQPAAPSLRSCWTTRLLQAKDPGGLKEKMNSNEIKQQEGQAGLWWLLHEHHCFRWSHFPFFPYFFLSCMLIFFLWNGSQLLSNLSGHFSSEHKKTYWRKDRRLAQDQLLEPSLNSPIVLLFP